MIKYILFLLSLYSDISYSFVINNNLSVNNLSINGFLKINNDSSLNTLILNGNTISLSNDCFFNKIILNGLDEIASLTDQYYYLMLNNNIIVASYIILNDTIYVNSINSVSNSIDINTKKNSKNIIFLNTVVANSLINLSKNITALHQNIVFNDCSFQNITITGNTLSDNSVFTLAPLCNLNISSPIIIINKIENTADLQLINQGGEYNLPKEVILSNLPKVSYSSNILFINSNNNNISKNTVNIPQYSNNTIDSLYTNTNLQIESNEEIILTNNQLISNLSKSTQMLLTLNAPDTVYLNALNLSLINPYSSKNISCNTLNIIQDVIYFHNISGSNIAGNANFTINAENIIYDRGQGNYLSILEWNTKIGTGLALVLDQNDQLFTIPASSKRFMENITPLTLSPLEFETAFKISDNNSEGIDFRKWEGTALETIIRYDEHGEPMMYEERDLLAVYYSQLPHLDKKIESLKNNIDTIKQYLENATKTNEVP
jgi:hypothetical protein